MNEDKLPKKVDDMIKILDDKEIKNYIQEKQTEDFSLNLKTNICEFFKLRMKSIEKQEEFKDKIQEKIEDMLDTLKFSELLQLFKIVYSETTLASDGIVSLFKPTPNTLNPLTEKLIGNNSKDDNTNEDFKNLTSEESQSLHKLASLIEGIINKK